MSSCSAAVASSGSNLCNRLLALGAHVTAVDTVFPSWRRPDVMCRRADLTSLAETVRAIVGAELVFHLAADMGGVGYFHSNADLGASLVNGQITLNVAQAVEAHETPTTFYASSACAYPVELQQTRGSAGALRGPDRSRHARRPVRGGEAPRAADHGQGARRPGRCPAHGVRAAAGARGRRMKFPAAVATKALAARSSGTLELWGDGSQLRSYLHVDGAVDRIITIATADRYDGPVNVGPGPVTCREIAELCLDIVGADADIVTNPAEPTGVLARDCSNARYDALYGPGPQRSLPGRVRVVHLVAGPAVRVHVGIPWRAGDPWREAGVRVRPDPPARRRPGPGPVRQRRRHLLPSRGPATSPSAALTPTSSSSTTPTWSCPPLRTSRRPNSPFRRTGWSSGSAGTGRCRRRTVEAFAGSDPFTPRSS